MDRDYEHDIVDLGQASVETKGVGINSFDGTGNALPATGLDDED